MLTKLYEKILGYARHRFAVPILCLVSLVEASFFPVPPDLLLIAMGLAQPRKAIWYAFLTTIFSVLGGVLGYLIGMYLWDWMSPVFFEYVFSPEKFEKVRALYENNAFAAIFLSGYTPIPYKIFTISAGVFGIPMHIFLIASILGRAMRFFIFGGLIYKYGDHARGWIQKHLRKIIWVSSVMITIIFVIIKVWIQ